MQILVYQEPLGETSTVWRTKNTLDQATSKQFSK